MRLCRRALRAGKTFDTSERARSQASEAKCPLLQGDQEALARQTLRRVRDRGERQFQTSWRSCDVSRQREYGIGLSRPATIAIAVEVVVPGERWEIEFLETGDLEVEIFKSNGVILDARALDDVCTRLSD